MVPFTHHILLGTGAAREPRCARHTPGPPSLLFLLFTSMRIVSVCSTAFFIVLLKRSIPTVTAAGRGGRPAGIGPFCLKDVSDIPGVWWVNSFSSFQSEKAFLLPLGLKDTFLV